MHMNPAYRNIKGAIVPNPNVVSLKTSKKKAVSIDPEDSSIAINKNTEETVEQSVSITERVQAIRKGCPYLSMDMSHPNIRAETQMLAIKAANKPMF